MLGAMDTHAMPSGRRLRRLLLPIAVLAALVGPVPAAAMAASVNDSTRFAVIPGPLGFGDPDQPQLPSLAFNVHAQAINAQMSNFAVTDASGAGEGWNLTVSGAGGNGTSPVLRQYCPRARCGGHHGRGFVAGGAVLPSGSMMLDSRGADFTSDAVGASVKPIHECDAGCLLDTSPLAPTRIVAAATGAGLGTFRAAGFSAKSLKLVAPGTNRIFQPHEVYRVDLSWTLNTGP
jgi:hypothetical protein